VNKNRVFALVMLMSLTAMGLASRDLRPHSAGAVDFAPPYETHLQIYREIRPVLLGARPGERPLCAAGGDVTP
jgi:hypothetical protein